LSEHPVALTASNADDASASNGRRKFGPPQAWPLLLWLNRAGARRYRYRLLQGAAIGLTINQCCLLWLGQLAGARATGQARLLGSTVFFSMGIALAAGWVLLGGWFDESTRALLGQMAARRGYSTTDASRLETLASWRWLALLLAGPIVVLAFVAELRMSTRPALLSLTSNLLLSLLFAQLAAAAVVIAVAGLKNLELRTARRIWLLACLLPELVRPIAPGFPTLRIVAAAMEQAIVRWGAGG
jgi:hypothetical protein